jgi:hypothetical protein
MYMGNAESRISHPNRDTGLLYVTRRPTRQTRAGHDILLPDRLFSGRPPLLFWRNPDWKGNREIETTPEKDALIYTGASLATGTLLPAAVIVAATFPSNPFQAAAEVTGLILGARLSVYLTRRHMRSVIK